MEIKKFWLLAVLKQAVRQLISWSYRGYKYSTFWYRTAGFHRMLGALPTLFLPFSAACPGVQGTGYCGVGH